MTASHSEVVKDPRDVLPSRDDSLVAASSAAIGGPAGARVRSGGGWWTAVRICLVLATLALALGYLLRVPCHDTDGSYDFSGQYSRICYSDIPHLFVGRGFAAGLLPYLESSPDTQTLEYPVLTGAFMQLASWITGSSGGVDARTVRFFDANVLLLSICLLAVVFCTALTARRRPWDAAMVALAPGVLLASFINWDLLAVALSAGFFLAWSRKHDVAAGVLLGAAVAAKFYPLLLLGPLFLVCLRSGDFARFRRTSLVAVLTWFAINLPIALLNFSAWSRFYSFSAERGEDFGSPWLMANLFGFRLPSDLTTVVSAAAFLLLCVGIAIEAQRANTAPRLAQLSFLTIAAFCLVNKVYSPQYVLWLIPLAVLARPRWRDFLIWQAGEVVYFLAVWYYLEGYDADSKGLPSRWYAAAIAVHLATTIYFAVQVIRDIRNPTRDPLADERPLINPDPPRRRMRQS